MSKQITIIQDVLYVESVLGKRQIRVKGVQRQDQLPVSKGWSVKNLIERMTSELSDK